MVEAVHRVALGRRPGVQGAEELVVVLLGQALDLDPDVLVPDQVENLGQERQQLAVSQAELAGLFPGKPRDRPDPGDVGVVVHDDRAVAGGVNVELHPIGIQHHGAPERGSGILVFVPGRAAVGDDSGSSHRAQDSPA